MSSRWSLAGWRTGPACRGQRHILFLKFIWDPLKNDERTFFKMVLVLLAFLRSFRVLLKFFLAFFCLYSIEYSEEWRRESSVISINQWLTTWDTGPSHTEWLSSPHHLIAVLHRCDSWTTDCWDLIVRWIWDTSHKLHFDTHFKYLLKLKWISAALTDMQKCIELQFLQRRKNKCFTK